MKLALLAILAALPAAAQVPLACQAEQPEVVRTVRAEGRAELVEDVVVTCTGGAPTTVGKAIPAANFTLTFDTNVTSKILGPGNASEALLLLDEPFPGEQYACPLAACTATGNGEGGGYYGPQGNYNIFQGVVGTGAAANTITWSNVPVDPPGPEGFRVFRFTNIRLNASPAKAAGSLHVTGIAATGQAPFQSIPVLTDLADLSPAMDTSVGDSSGANPAPNGVALTLTEVGSTTPARAATLSYAMRFTGAAVPRTDTPPASPDAPGAPVDQTYPGGFYFSESGFYSSQFPATPGGNLGIAGLADWGTRLMATFRNIPAGVTVYVSLRNDPSNAPAVSFIGGPMARLTATDANGAGSFSAVAGDGTIAQLTAVNGTATAVWEVLGANPESLDSYSFGVWFSYGPAIYPAPGPITVTMRLAPLAGGVPLFDGSGATQTLATFTSTTPPPPPTPTLSVSPGSLTFSATAGGNIPPAQSLTIFSSTTGVAYAVSGGGVLSLRAQPSGGVAPGTTSISINTQSLSPGTYSDVLSISSAGTSVQVPVTVRVAPAPVITGLSPASAIAGSPAFTLTVSGANFTAGTAVTWNGSALATTFGGATQLTAQVPATLVAAPGQASVIAMTPDAAKSKAALFTILPFSLNSISPATVMAGGPAFALTASGVGFQTGATVNVGGAAVQPVSSSAGSISVTVPASAIAQPGALSVSVSNPGGLTSNSLTLTVVPALTLASIAPGVVTATHPAFSMTLAGTGFAAGATVQVGSSSANASGSATSLTATVPAAAVARPGTLPVQVSNANGFSSNALTLTVNPAPVLTAVAPASATAGAAGLTLTVSGTGLFAGSTVQWNGQGLATSGSGPSQLTAQLPAALLANEGPASITVVSFDGVLSNALPFAVGPAASITSLNPSTANVGSGAFTLTVTGSNLQPGATVNWNGQGLATAFVSPTQLTAQVPATLLTAVATASVTVASPGGAVTGSLPFRVVLPPLTNVSFGAPGNSSSGQDQPVTLTLGGTYPVDLIVTVTLTFAPDAGLPDDATVQFQNGSRTVSFTVAAGTPASVPAVLLKTGTIAGVITISATFTTSGGTDVTPPGIAPQRIQIGRTAPVISSVTCTRNSAGFTVVVDGYTNTREVTQSTFDFSAASGQSLGTTELQVTTTSIFSGWFGSGAGATVGGLFRYTQPFTVNGSATIAGITVKLGNSVGTSAAVSCQLQ